MKRFFVLSLLGVAACTQAAGTYSLSMTAGSAGKLAHDPDLGYYVADTGNGTLNATLPMSDVDVSQFDANTPFSLSVDGSTVWESLLGDDSSYRAGKRSFRQSSSSGQLTLSWTTNKLTVSGSATFDVFQVGSLYSGTEGPIANEPHDVEVDLGDFSFTRTVYFNGSSTTATRTAPDGTDFDFITTRVSGAADLTAPTVTITVPAANFVTTNGAELTLRGTAADNIELSEVDYALATTPDVPDVTEFQPAALLEATNLWTATLTPTPGTNYVFVKAVDASGNVSTVVRRSFYYLVRSQLMLNVQGSGTVTGVTNLQWLELGRSYTAKAVPGRGQVLAHWEIAEGAKLQPDLVFTASLQPNLVFTMTPGLELTAVFAANPFPALKGTYTGLFFDAQGTGPTNAGSFVLTVTSNGGFSGKLTTLAGSYPLAGQCGLPPGTEFAEADFFLPAGKLPAVGGGFTVDLSGSGQVSGNLTFLNGTTPTASAQFSGRLNRAATKNPASLYNLAFFPDPAVPAGYGFGTASIAGSGTVTLTLNLADASPVIVASSAQATDGGVTVFAPLYANKGFLLGWFGIGTNGLEGIDFTWFKPASKAGLYSEGFEAYVPIQGAPYSPPKAGTNILHWTAGTITLDGGGLTTPITTSLTFNPAKGQFGFPTGNPNHVSLTLVPATGGITGSFLPPGAKKAVSFKALVLPNASAGFGYFAGAGASGSVVLQSSAIGQ